MSRKNSITNKVNLQSFDDLFPERKEPSEQANGVIDINIEELHTFSYHPFRVQEDEKMEELTESIQQNGIIEPIIVRERSNGGYEIIAGHRRTRASILAGKKTIPAYVKDYDDDTAAIVMVDTNNKRENLLCSEKAWAYRIKMDAVKHQGKKGENSAYETGNQNGDSKKTVERYVRLTYLSEELLNLVDIGKLTFMAGHELSFLNEEEQTLIIHYYNEKGILPSTSQATKIKNLARTGMLENDSLDTLLAKKTEQEKLSVIKPKVLRKYFPTNYSMSDIEREIISLLEERMKQDRK